MALIIMYVLSKRCKNKTEKSFEQTEHGTVCKIKYNKNAKRAREAVTSKMRYRFEVFIISGRSIAPL